ncbi:MAG: hypothetical protein R3C56_12945 [Pirellulaceae bacterium]
MSCDRDTGRFLPTDAGDFERLEDETLQHPPRGLILLIVLSMLTLFSLLAISYVVFSGQSRSLLRPISGSPAAISTA